MYQVMKQTGIFTIVLGIILTLLTFFNKDTLITAFIDNREIDLPWGEFSSLPQ